MEIEFESIADHSAQAPFYKFRTPYLPKYFEALTQELDLSSESVLLDICCGSGELARGLQAKVAKIYAIDGSAEMLAHAPKFDNVTYSQCDVNAENYMAAEPVDHFVIGRAIHWIDADALERIAASTLKDGGKIAICSTQWFADGPWGVAYKEVLQKYNLFSDYAAINFSGSDKLHEAGFKAVRKIRYNSLLRCDLAHLMGHSLASAYGKNFRFLMDNRELFQDHLLQALGPHLVKGMLQKKIVNWALFFERV